MGNYKLKTQLKKDFVAIYSPDKVFVLDSAKDVQLSYRDDLYFHFEADTVSECLEEVKKQPGFNWVKEDETEIQRRPENVWSSGFSQ